jgi:hypothetical protein
MESISCYIRSHDTMSRRSPAIYGPGKTPYNLFQRWAAKGVWSKLFHALATAEGPPAELLIDSSAVKAHRCASGANGGAEPGDRPVARRSHDQDPRPDRAASLDGSSELLQCRSLGFGAMSHRSKLLCPRKWQNLRVRKSIGRPGLGSCLKNIMIPPAMAQGPAVSLRLVFARYRPAWRVRLSA